MKKEESRAGKSFLFCLDDVDAWSGSNPDHLSQFIKFFGEHKSWLSAKDSAVVEFNNQVLATARLVGAPINFDAVQISIDEVEKQDLIKIFKRSLKEKFLAFELDIQFLITKVIMASVDINKIFIDSNRQRGKVFFHIQENMKIIAGLTRAHKDCHDTRYELIELWINELLYTYFEKLPEAEMNEMTNKVNKVLMYYFGQEAVELLEKSRETMIGDFLDSYGFYTTIEIDELKDHVIENIDKLNSKHKAKATVTHEQKINIIPTDNTLNQICQMIRVMELEHGHMLIYGSAVIDQRSVVELVCFMREFRFMKLTYCDINVDRWKKAMIVITKYDRMMKGCVDLQAQPKFLLKRFREGGYFHLPPIFCPWWRSREDY